jgi:hypothetical protein
MFLVPERYGSTQDRYYLSDISTSMFLPTVAGIQEKMESSEVWVPRLCPYG